MISAAASIDLKIVFILTVGFSLASLFGYIAHRLKLPPILGFLCAGYLIGPYSPGFVADVEVAEQLAEIGVILMMFGVGLRLKWQDLLRVRNVALTGALLQTVITAMLCATFLHSLGWSLITGIFFGLGIGVASTVVMVRVLSDHNLLNTQQGHIAVGWTIVEDVITVIILILIPPFAGFIAGKELQLYPLIFLLIGTFLKVIFLAILMFTIGSKLVTYALTKVMRINSQELFIISVLALTFIIATASAVIFGSSIALGAFIAGLIIGQTHVRHLASIHATPLKDVFTVIFFLSVGMLFNPTIIVDHFFIFSGILMIILLVKPLVAGMATFLMQYPWRVALPVGLALAQVGEFSFILAEEGTKFHLFPDEAYDIIVACALVSITLNPLLFKLLKPADHSLSSRKSVDH